MAGIASSILATAPARFALAGLSMGGYIAYEIVRQAPERVERLALLDTGYRADTPERTAGRRDLVANAEREGVRRAQELLMPVLIHPSRFGERPLVESILQMAVDTGAGGLQAPGGRPHRSAGQPPAAGEHPLSDARSGGKGGFAHTG